MGTITRVNPQDLSLKERIALKRSRKALLLDISSSMNTEIEPGKTRLDALKDIVSGIPTETLKIAFNSYAYTVNEMPLHGSGATKMSLAIEMAKSMGYKAALMITDGEATDKLAALESIKGFDLQTMYVGSGERPAFLDQLSRKATTEDLKMMKELTAKIVLLLEEGKSGGGFQL